MSFLNNFNESFQLGKFSIRIISIDYYLTKPNKEWDIIYSSFHGNSIDRVPVVRIFGSTLKGQKTCLHLHKVI